MQEGTELLPFLEGLSPLAARLPAREAASAAQHLQAAARPFNPQGSESESSWLDCGLLQRSDLYRSREGRQLCAALPLQGAGSTQQCGCGEDLRPYWGHAEGCVGPSQDSIHSDCQPGNLSTHTD